MFDELFTVNSEMVQLPEKETDFKIFLDTFTHLRMNTTASRCAVVSSAKQWKTTDSTASLSTFAI